MLEVSSISVAPSEHAKTILNTPALPSFTQPTHLHYTDIGVSTSHQTQQKKIKKMDNDNDETTSSTTSDDNNNSSEDDNNTKDAITPTTVIINFYLIIS